MIKFKAWNASNSKAIAKFHNAEIGHFGHNAFIHELIRGSLAYLDNSLSRQDECNLLYWICSIYFYAFVVDGLYPAYAPCPANQELTARRNQTGITSGRSGIDAQMTFHN
jgi:hypothetical protein